MRKNPHSKTLRAEPKEQHLNTGPKSCPNDNRVTTMDKIN